MLQGCSGQCFCVNGWCDVFYIQDLKNASMRSVGTRMKTDRAVTHNILNRLMNMYSLVLFYSTVLKHEHITE